MAPPATSGPAPAGDLYQADRVAGFPCACGRAWAGAARCHCTACHHTFTSAEAFDLHRRSFRCRPPATCGLVLCARSDWGLPGERPDVGPAAAVQLRLDLAAGPTT